MVALSNGAHTHHAVTIDGAVTIDLLLRVRSSDSNLFTFQRYTPRIWGTFRACYF